MSAEKKSETTEENFTTSSGKEITVHIDESGEPVSISFSVANMEVVLSENEVFEIHEWLEDYGSEDE